MDQAEHNYSNPKKHYEKLGSAGIGGNLYQLHLLTIVLLNGLRKVAHWRLSTEDKKAAQLDDLIFQHLPSESTILLQAKHKEDEKKQVTYKDLMSVNKNSEFSLPKYFFSYQEVKSNFKVQNVIICTNLNLDENTKSILEEERVDPDSVLHFEGAENICYGFRRCSLPGLKQSIKTYQAKNVINKEVVISDEDIDDFLQHLKFFPDCLGDKNVENIVRKTISLVNCSGNLNIKMIQKDIHKKMTDWFKEKKGRYLTEVEAKAFFCDMRSNKYCEDLTKLYDICFKNNNLPSILHTQQKQTGTCEKSLRQNEIDTPAKNPKRIFHIIPDEEYMLNVVKIYQALPPYHEEKALFVNPGETVEVQKEIIDAFAIPHYTILVMVSPNTLDGTIAGEMYDRMMETLNTHKYKHVILIAEERNNLATRLKYANTNYYEVITDNITFADLEETTYRKFKGKKLIDFQGYTMSLEELFPSSTETDLNQIVTSEMIINLARGDTSKVGLDLPHLDKYYINRSFHRKGQNISEEDLWRSTEVNEEKIILISDSAGIGKSSVLTSLGVSIKRNNPHLWVVRIDLNNYTSIMRTTLEKGRKSVGVIEMLNSHEKSILKSEFDKKLFMTSKRVVLMLDGVDEISPTYTEFVINLIKDSVVQVNFAKIFVTTRPHMSKDFEEISELQSFMFESSLKNHRENNPGLKFFTLEPFSKVNQIDFLTKYWTDALDLQDDMTKTKCNIFAEALIENTSKWINKNDQSNFAGIPLQTSMLAEIFQEKNQIIDEDCNWEGCKEFSLSNNEKPELPTRIDLTQLYGMFIGTKCDIFIKKSNPSRHSVADEALKLQLKKCQKFHRALSLKMIFDSNEQLQYFTCYTKNVDWPISNTFANNFLFGVGIVQKQGETIEFLHRTFAEYFVTECLLIELERKSPNEKFQEFFMDCIMMDREMSAIRTFLDSRMPNVLQNNFRNYFRRNRISEWSLSRYVAVFAAGGHVRILECFVKCVDKEQREILCKTVNDLYFMADALNSAVRYGHMNILKLLLELNDTFNTGKDAHTKFLQWTVMRAVHHNLETFEFLLRQVDKNGKNILGRSDLHQAAFTCRLEEIKSLVEEGGVDINNKNNILGWTALREAAFMRRLDVVKFLVEEVGADINIKDNIHGWTALHEAAFMRRLDAVKFLVEEAGADVNAKDNGGWTALHKAVLANDLVTVKFLVEETGADIDDKNRTGRTALSMAAFMRQFDVVKYLVEAGANINVTNNRGETTLHRAAFMRRFDVATFLVEAGANINVTDNDGETALHKATREGDLEIVKLLVEKAGENINVADNYGETALHKAAREGNLETVKFLVEAAGAKTNIKNNQGRTALHVAAGKGRWEVVKFMSNSSRWVMFKMKTVHFFRGKYP